MTHNTLNSSQPAYLRSLLSHHTPAHSLCFSNTNLLSVPRVHTTFASRGFSVAVPSVWNSLPADIRACSSPHTSQVSIVFLKPTAFLIRPSVLPSGSHKCLRFGIWSTLCTVKNFIYLLTYLNNDHYNELNTISNLSYKADVSTSSDVFFRTESESTLLREVSDDVETLAL